MDGLTMFNAGNWMPDPGTSSPAAPAATATATPQKDYSIYTGAQPQTDGSNISTEATSPTPSQPTNPALLNNITSPSAGYDPRGTNGSNTTPVTTPMGSQTLKYGTQNPTQIKQLQQFLNGTGAKLDVDGKFGPLTKAALQQYQSGQGLKQADGIMGPETRSSINNNISSANNIRQQQAVSQVQEDPSRSVGTTIPQPQTTDMGAIT